MRLLQTTQVLARFQRADEQQVLGRQPIPVAHPGDVVGRRRGTASTPSGTWRSFASSSPASTQSAIVARDEQSTSAARRRTRARLRSKTSTPRRVNWSGACRQARSWIVLTSGARVGQGITVVAWATSTAPVAISTRGWPMRSHDSYSAGLDTGSRFTSIGRLPRVRRRAAVPPGDADHPHAPASDPARRRSAVAATAVPPGTRCQHCSSV